MYIIIFVNLLKIINPESGNHSLILNTYSHAHHDVPQVCKFPQDVKTKTELIMDCFGVKFDRENM